MDTETRLKQLEDKLALLESQPTVKAKQQLTNPLDYVSKQIINSAISTTSSTMTGGLIFWVWPDIPSWGLIANGQAVSRTTYLNLFNLFGTAFGSGDGSATFNLPDMRGLVPAGYKQGDPNFNSFGTVTGAATVTLTINEMPAHSHTTGASLQGSAVPGTGFNSGGSNQITSTDTVGNGNPHANIQPSYIGYWLVII